MSCAPRAALEHGAAIHGSGGNPLLDPFLANQFDLSYECYFGPEAWFAMAVFYKDVESHIGYTTRSGDHRRRHLPGDGSEQRRRRWHQRAEFTFQTPFAS